MSDLITIGWRVQKQYPGHRWAVKVNGHVTASGFARTFIIAWFQARRMARFTRKAMFGKKK